MEMTKEDLMKELLKSVESYEKMYDENLDKMAQYQERIEGLKQVNKNNLETIKKMLSQIEMLKK